MFFFGFEGTAEPLETSSRSMQEVYISNYANVGSTSPSEREFHSGSQNRGGRKKEKENSSDESILMRHTNTILFTQTDME